MESTTIDSKLSAPDCGQMLIRQRLIDNTDTGKPFRFNLICADAGCGKTVLMGQLHARDPSIAVWYQLDRFDAEPRVFISHLVDGLGRHLSGFGVWVKERLRAASSRPFEIDSMLLTFVRELSDLDPGPVSFYLDDYHLVGDSEHIKGAIRFLVNNLHEGCRIVIGTRKRPEGLSLGKLKAQADLVEIDSKDLRFTADETAALAEKSDLSLAADDIALMHEKTDGWAVALALAGFACNSSGLPRSISDLSAATHDIHDYMSEEIWSHMDRQLRDVLLRCSLLNTINLSLYTRAFGDTASKSIKKIMDEAVARNMMIVRLDDSGYRLHPLFREFLKEKVGHEFGHSAILDLHLAYAESHIEMGQEVEAIDHLIEAESFDRAIEILIDHGDQVIDSGSIDKIEKWINKMRKVNIKNAWIEYFASKLHQLRGDLPSAISTCTYALDRFMKYGDGPGIYSSASTLGHYFFHYEDIEKAIYYSNLALDHASNIEDKANCMCAIAEAYVWEGKYLRATTILSNEAFFESASKQVRLRKRYVQSSIDYVRGDFTTLNIKLNDIKLDSALTELPQKEIQLLFNIATCSYLTGKYESAMKLLNEIIDKADNLGDYKIKCMIKGTMGIIKCSIGDTNKGLEQIKISKAELHNAGYEDAISPMHLGTAYRRQGEYDSALRCHQESLEIAEKTKLKYTLSASYANIGADYLYINREKSGSFFEIAEAYARRFGFSYILTQIYFHRACDAFRRHRHDTALSFIAIALGIASKHAHNHFIAQEGKNYAELLSLALERGIERDYLCDIIGHIGEEAIAYVKGLLNCRSSDTRLSGIKALTAIGGSSAVSLIKRRVNDEDLLIRLEADKSLELLRRELMKDLSNSLTRRENEVCKLIAEGHSNAEIADQLYISELTVKTHVSKIYKKLGFTNRAQLICSWHNK